jgi:hypothetical protein
MQMRQRVGQVSNQLQGVMGSEVIEARLALIGHQDPDTHFGWSMRRL